MAGAGGHYGIGAFKRGAFGLEGNVVFGRILVIPEVL